jgi:hypothetical protein
MTKSQTSKLPLPILAKGFRFRFVTSPAWPVGAVLEVDTDTNPIRIGFDRAQLEALSRQAAIAAAKIRGS